MQKIELYWDLRETGREQPVQRYCKNCGQTVLFRDTHIRRHNANGKNIFQFAIYKCDKDHTWNKKLSVYKAFSEHFQEYDSVEHRLPVNTHASDHPDGAQHSTLSISSYQEQRISELTIIIEEVAGHHRIDKVLADRLEEWSREQIIKKIKEGEILLNGHAMKPSTRLNSHDRITIQLIDNQHEEEK